MNSFGGEFQAVDPGFTHDAMGEPLIGKFVSAVRIGDKDPPIQEQLAGQQKARTPRRVRELRNMHREAKREP